MQNVKVTSSWGVGLLEILNEMRKLDEMCDLHLVLKGGIIIKAHSCVIAAASPFLKSLLINTQNPEINMEDFPTEVINQIIEFIYTGEVTVQGDDLVTLHNVAISLHIPVLASVVQNLIHNSKAPETSDATPERPSQDVMTKIMGGKNVSGQLHSNDIKPTIPQKRRPGRPRKYPLVEKTPQSDKPGPNVDGSHNAHTSLERMSETVSQSEISESTKQTHDIQQIQNEVIMASGHATGSEDVDGVNTGQIVYLSECHDANPEKNILIKLEREEDNIQVMNNDVVCTSSQQSTQGVGEVVMTTYQDESVNKQCLLTAIETALTVESAPSVESKPDPCSLNPPRKKTAQGAALAAKVPVHLGPTFTCMTCNRSFTNEDMYNRHCSRHRNETTDVKRFACQFCKFSTMYKAVLDEHVHVHTGEKPYGCTQCDKAFKHKKSLQIHMWIHAGKKYPCPLCGKEMSTAQYMRRHLNNVHSDYRPYKCSTCSRCFNRSESLKKHMDTHNEVPKYECVVCNSMFLTQIALKNHMTNKHKERQRYCCLKCGNEFINLHRIKSHRCQPPDDGKRRRPRSMKDAQRTDQAEALKPQNNLSESHQVEPQPDNENAQKDGLLPDHVYTPQKKEASQVMIITSNNIEDEEIEDTDGETSSEDDDDELMDMDLDEPEEN